MNDVVITAASYVCPTGYGNIPRGRQSWQDEAGNTVSRKDLGDISWSAMFSSPCSRFGRMDPLSRAGLMAVELLEVDFAAMDDSETCEIGVFMESLCGSLSTDMEFLETLSPSVFVYTLPSSTIGEICIRHRLKGPILCLMSASSSPGKNVVQEALHQLQSNDVRGLICLYCDAISASAAGTVKSLLDHPGEFCWYVCALYLEKGGADGHRLATPEDILTDTADILEICERLCHEHAC